MINDTYAKAYKEVIEIIKYFPEEEYNKIPKEKIEYYKKNMDKEYSFTINPRIDLAEQNISKEASAIIVTIFRDYFATEEQKKELEELIKLNEKKKEIENTEKYNPDNLFKNRNANIAINEQTIIDKDEGETDLVEYKQTFFNEFKNFIIKVLQKLNFRQK